MMKRNLFVLLIVFINLSRLHSQYYETGSDPASLKWMRIRTERFDIIYPETYSAAAKQYAYSLENAAQKLSVLYPVKKARIPVVIHNYTTFSNGYVAWAPSRMELFPTPEQNTIPLDPVDQLAIHEMTHVMQMRSLNRGFTRAASLFLGQQAAGAASALAPMWFLEGDAVLAESWLTESGRGRSAAFQKQMKALITGKTKNYSYDRMLHGSFRVYTPDHYRFGYQMVTWAAAKNSHELWKSTLDYIAKFPFSIVPVNLNLYNKAGLTKSTLYKQSFDSLRTNWSETLNGQAYTKVNKSKGKEYINYYSPVIVGKDSVAAIKTSLGAPPSFVLVNPSDGSEKRIHIPGYIYPWFISGARGKIVWVEQTPDPRWENRDYSVIRILNLKTGKTGQLSSRSRYLSASISPDGRLIAAAENTVGNENNISIIDAFNGEVIRKINTPGNAFPQKPVFDASGEKILTIALSAEGEGILSFTLNSGIWETLLEYGREDLQSAFLRSDSLFYVSSESGTENLWVKASSHNPQMITRSVYGITDPSFSEGKVYFSDYTISGNDLATADLRSLSGVEKPGKATSAFLINRLEPVPGIKETGKPEITETRYRKWQHPFRIHSWLPFYADIENLKSDPTNIKPGITLMSQNNLSTLITTAGYEYSGGRHLFHTGIRWQGWLPVLESGFDYGYESVVLKPNAQTPDPSELNPGLVFSNTLSIPLRFSTGRFTQQLYVSATIDYSNRYIYQAETSNYDYGQTMVTFRGYISNLHRKAERDIYPSWGQVIDFNFSSFPGDRNIYGTLSTLRSAFYFPGILRNHSLRLRYQSDFQVLPPSNRILGNRADLPRGYYDIISVDYKLYSADYVLPLFYPDMNIPGVLFVKRIRGGLFYDYAAGDGNYYINATTNKYHDYRETFRSFGTELLADFHVLRIPFLISAGVQAAWKDTKTAPSISGIFRIDIYGFKVGREKI